jgi:hypothetical protein
VPKAPRGRRYSRDLTANGPPRYARRALLEEKFASAPGLEETEPGPHPREDRSPSTRREVGHRRGISRESLKVEQDNTTGECLEATGERRRTGPTIPASVRTCPDDLRHRPWSLVPSGATSAAVEREPEIIPVINDFQQGTADAWSSPAVVASGEATHRDMSAAAGNGILPRTTTARRSI